MWQFLCDSLYDLFHLNDQYGQKTLDDWWETRKFEWNNLRVFSIGLRGK